MATTNKAIKTRNNFTLRTKFIYILLFVSINVSGNAQVFTEQTDIIIPGIYDGSVDWGDYNNDGLLDFMIAGQKEDNTDYAAIYENNGDNSFTEYASIIQPVKTGSLDWGDYNNDNYIDILLSGGHVYSSTYTRYTEIYKNNKNETFSNIEEINLTKASGGVVKWGDYSNDSYADIFQSGVSSTDFISKIYRNEKNNTFSEQTQIEIMGVMSGSISWGDYNNDGLLDFIYMGRALDYWITKIYKNNGDGIFKQQDYPEIINVSLGTVEWGDYNNDGYLDFIISGQREGETLTKIYRNNGNETFSELSDVNLIGISEGSSIWGDYDNDGLLDVLVTGWAMVGSNGETQARIYKNEGNDIFAEQTDISFTPVGGSATAFCDYDNDDDLDILLTGVYASSAFCSKIYKNNITTLNIKPNLITNLQTEITGNSVFFSWDEATDDNQASEGLSYNIYVYEEDNPLPYTASPQAFPQTHELNGKRLLAQRGHIQGIRENGQVSYFLIDVFEQGKTYHWSVQAIDASFAGGEFAPEQPFVYDTTVNIHEIYNSKIIIAPNPTSGIFIINMSAYTVDERSQSNILITDITGKQVFNNQYSINNNQLQVDLSEQNSGIYFLTVFKNNQPIHTETFIKH